MTGEEDASAPVKNVYWCVFGIESFLKRNFQRVQLHDTIQRNLKFEVF